jgi:hypothetical protein
VVSAQKSLSASGRASFGFFADGSICARTIRLDCADVVDAIGVAATGTAVALSNRRNGCESSSNTIITGGGRARNTSPPTNDVRLVDVSGTNPRVATCTAALSAARSASATLAALPVTRALGNINVAAGSEYHIDATGGAVINIDSLTLLGGSPVGYVGGALFIHAGREDIVVVNVLKQLILGELSYIEGPSYGTPITFVLNVPGRGPAVQMSSQALAYVAVPAPERTIRVQQSIYGTCSP